MENEQEVIQKINLKDIKKVVIKNKKGLSVFKVPENWSGLVYHSKKYYEQVVSMPEPDKEQMTADITQKSEEKVTKQRSKKKRLASTIFLLINLAIVVGILLWNFLGNSNSMSFEELLTRQINWWWLLVGVLMFVLINFTDSIRVFTMILYSTKRARPFTSYKSVGMCRFYDSVTPMSTGGQPFQVFYLNKRGLPAGTATSVPIAKYLYSQFYSIIFTAIVLICQHTYIVSLNPWILTIAYVGFALNALLIGSILFLSVSKKVAPSCAVGILKLLAKMKIVKDYRKSFVKVMKTVREYVATMRQFVSNGWVAVFMFLSSLLYTILNYSLPFIVYATFMPLDASWFSIYLELFTIGMICDLACSIMPIPGGTGLAEVSFAALFSSFFTTSDGYNIVVWALLLWRIYTYYGYLIQGLFIMFYDFVHGNKKIKPLLERFEKEDKEEALKEKEEPVVKVVKNRRK